MGSRFQVDVFRQDYPGYNPSKDTEMKVDSVPVSVNNPEDVHVRDQQENQQISSTLLPLKRSEAPESVEQLERRLLK